MIERLDLNYRELRKDRNDILDRTDFVDPATGKAESYAHVVCERLGTVIP